MAEAISVLGSLEFPQMSYFCEDVQIYTYYGVATLNIGNNPHSKIDDGYRK